MSDSGRQIGDPREEQYISRARPASLHEVYTRVKNGSAVLGRSIAYAAGDEIKISKLKAIETLSRGYGQSSATMVTLDDGTTHRADNVVVLE